MAAMPRYISASFITACRGDQLVMDNPFVGRFGRAVALSALEWAVVAVLAKDAPDTRHVAHETIEAAVYAGARDAPTGSRACVAVIVSRLRKLLAPLGVEIKGIWGWGYHLVLLEAPAA
jgi:hypothetical protein